MYYDTWEIIGFLAVTAYAVGAFVLAFSHRGQMKRLTRDITYLKEGVHWLEVEAGKRKRAAQAAHLAETLSPAEPVRPADEKPRPVDETEPYAEVTGAP